MSTAGPFAIVIDGQPVNFTCNITTPLLSVDVTWLDGNGRHRYPGASWGLDTRLAYRIYGINIHQILPPSPHRFFNHMSQRTRHNYRANEVVLFLMGGFSLCTKLEILNKDTKLMFTVLC